MEQLIGTFNLASSEWKLLIDNNLCDRKGVRWLKNTGVQTIRTRDFYDGMKLMYSSIEKNLWDGILTAIIIDTMQYHKMDSTIFLSPFNSILHQGLKTLTCKPGQWDGTFSVGGTDYIVCECNSEYMDEKRIFGECQPTPHVVLIQTEYQGQPFVDGHIMTTIIHEVIHAVNDEIGLTNSKSNSEKFVNTLASFIYEVMQTIKMELPDEADNKTVKA